MIILLELSVLVLMLVRRSLQMSLKQLLQLIQEIKVRQPFSITEKDNNFKYYKCLQELELIELLQIAEGVYLVSEK